MAMLSKRKLNLSYDSSNENSNEVSDLFTSQLTGKKSSFSPDPVKKGALDLSYAPKKTFGAAVEDYSRKNPNRDGGLVDKRVGSEYDREMKASLADSFQRIDNYERTREGTGRGRENMGSVDEMPDAGPAGLKSGQSRKSSPEEAIDKTFNRR